MENVHKKRKNKTKKINIFKSVGFEQFLRIPTRGEIMVKWKLSQERMHRVWVCSQEKMGIVHSYFLEN